MVTPRLVKCIKHDTGNGNIKEYEWDKEIFVEESLQDDLLMLQNVFEGSIISSHVYPLVFEKKCDRKEVTLRSLEFYQEVEKDKNFFKQLSADDKLFFLIGLRDLFVASTKHILNDKENKLLQAMVELVDKDGGETLVQKRINNMLVTPYPTSQNKIVKFAPVESETISDEYFIRNELGLIMVFVDPADLSYHNFENIINLDALFKDITADNFVVSNFKKQEGHEIYTFDLKDKASVLLSLDKYGLYVPPLNKLSRGGQRFIFSSRNLSKSLGASFRQGIPDEKLMDDRFKLVNYVFRYNKFKPNDSKFSNHYDTPYHDPYNQQYSKYTLILYLTPGTADPVLSFDNGNCKIDYIDCKEGISGVIFDQKYEHEGKSFFSTDKIFLRSELIYEYLKSHMNFDDLVSKQFNVATYMTKQSVFNPELEKYVSQCYDQAAKARLNIANVSQIDDSKFKLIFKSHNDVQFITNGYDYWFRKNISLTDAAIYLLLDYFNSTYETKDHFNKLTYSELIDVNVKGTEEIADLLQKMSGSQNEGKISVEEKKDGEEKMLIENEKAVEEEKVMNGDIIKEESDNGERSEAGSATTFDFSDFEDEDCEQYVGVSRLNETKRQKNQLINKLKNKFNISINDKTVEINKSKIKITKSLIIFKSQIPVINFAGGETSSESEEQERDYLEWRNKSLITYTSIPSIPYQILENCYHLKMELFHNGFVRKATHTIKYPTHGGDDEDEGEERMEEENVDDEDQMEEENVDNGDEMEEEVNSDY